MHMQGTRRIAASRETVWAALNDPEILKQSLPGCESVSKLSDTAFDAVAKLRVGPVSALFKAKIKLSDIDPPHGYRISGEGQGGAAGFAKGGALVRLEADGEETELTYSVDAMVGGKLAQLGARLIDATAKKMADEFFERFDAAVAPPTPMEAGAIEETPEEAAGESRRAVWTAVVVAAIALIVYLLIANSG